MLDTLAMLCKQVFEALNSGGPASGGMASSEDAGGESVSGRMPVSCAPLGQQSRLMGKDMPETRYARSGDVMVAYQMLGDGPFDVAITTDSPFSRGAAVEAGGLDGVDTGMAEQCD